MLQVVGFNLIWPIFSSFGSFSSTPPIDKAIYLFVIILDVLKLWPCSVTRSVDSSSHSCQDWNLVFNVWWRSGAASEAGDGAQRGGPEQGEAAEEPPGAHRVHTHAEDHEDLHTQPLQSECVSIRLLISHTHTHTFVMHLKARCFPSPCQQHVVVVLSLKCFVSPGDRGGASADYN